MTTTTHQANQITTNRMVILLFMLAWAVMVIGSPLAMAVMVYLPAGKIGLAIGNVVLAAIMSAPWMAFGLPVVRRFVRDL
ncbi:MAG TPA: hypothetical protein VK165_10040 [Azonexus sp.]|nr:hypothetical protein [Azonexus sp.]